MRHSSFAEGMTASPDLNQPDYSEEPLPVEGVRLWAQRENLLIRDGNDRLAHASELTLWTGFS